ncbi:FAST kinase domain-containing protein 5, mitochondrial [Nerophis lumbriciformis]|uniref:FAST kinase domain-containing protein 5, mitochondrial n=1 Tax=Nerophis lumbriciformis TaxID=546530 RepID=UPI002AE04CAB|nr:FAST kinase domain-containing protein 5, mitochondrial-like [Nerophis lumbriciformis]XP_061827420.1 FAST kinase domain-containing protein 5, mitochondrial-like [Nerophis lumbriciformis]
MAARVLCSLRARLCYLPGLRKGYAHCAIDKLDNEMLDEKDRIAEDSQLLDAYFHEGYNLHYNPSSYHYPVGKSALSSCQSVNDDKEQCLVTVAPSVWQPSNRYRVTSSRHISNLAINKGSELKKTQPSHHTTPVSPDVKVDTRAFIKCRPEYSTITLDLTQRPPPINWEHVVQILQRVSGIKDSMKPSDVSRFIVDLSHIHTDNVSLVKSEQRFVMLLRYMVENLHLFSLTELLDVLRSFVWLEMPRGHTVLQPFEDELIRRADEMRFDQLLLAADLWRCIGRKVPQFLKHLYDLVHLYLGQVEVPELVQLLYIMGEGRYCPKVLVQPIEQLLMRQLHHLQPEEVGTLCLGLFKSQTSLSEAAVISLFDKAHSHVEDMSDFAIVNVLKYMRFSYFLHRPFMEAMTHEVPRRAGRMGVSGLMHVALTCSAMRYRNDRILAAVAEEIPSLVPQCRSKDSCKLLWAFGTLGFLPVQRPNLYPSLTEDLRKKKAEFQQYPEHLLTGLLGLAYVSQFPEDLIALALNPDFVNLALTSTKLDLKKDLFTLDGVVALELPHWTGPRLSRELRQEVTEMLWNVIQPEICQKPEVKWAETTLQELLGGEEFVCKRMILPHMRSIDFEVHLDPSGQPIPVSTECQTATISPQNCSSKSASNHSWERINSGVSVTDELIAQLANSRNAPIPTIPPSEVRTPSIVEPDESGKLFKTGLNLRAIITDMLTKPNIQKSSLQDSVVKLAIQVPSRNHYCYKSQQLLGLHAMKMRQLKMAGYRVVELCHHEWGPLLRKSRTEKMAYLHCKVFNSLDS